MLNGVEWRMGLWYGCRHNSTDDTWLCSTDVFKDEVFKTGKSRFLFGFVKKHGRQGAGLIFPIYLYRKL